MKYLSSMYKTESSNTLSAFTLIELSIVLVILGLIVGGILTGQTLIHQAEIRSQIKQFQDYTLAYNTFKLKYNCVAGDCSNATSFLVQPIPLAIR